MNKNLSDNHKVKELKKRIDHLDNLLLQKKALVENELLQVENLCKELIKLHEQYKILSDKKGEEK